MFNSYTEFQNRYRNDFAGFIRDCIIWKEGEGPSFYQEEIARDLVTYKRECDRGPHGLGKTALIAWAVHWFALTNDGDVEHDWKIPITASAWRQLTKFAWPEIKKWSRRLRWDVIGREPYNERLEMQQLNLSLKTGSAFALASNNAAFIEGAHASRVLYIFDESKEIPFATWDAAEGASSIGDCLWLAVSTPGEPVGRFYDIQSRKPGYEDWHVRHVTKDDAIKAGRMNPVWAEARLKQWTENSAAYQNRVAGNFASSEADGVIPLKWIELANARWYANKDAKVTFPFKCVGSDIARSGEDSTCLALRYGMMIDHIRKTSLEDTMQTTGRISAILQKHGGYAIVDVIGIGAGVVDRLGELKFNVVSFNASEHTDRLDSHGEFGFVNKRAAAWWNMRELLDPDSGNDIALPPDDLLTGDLVSVHWKVMSGGKIQVESKDDIKKRIGRSTDDGDAVVMAFFEDATPSANDWVAAMKKKMEKDNQ